MLGRYSLRCLVMQLVLSMAEVAGPAVNAATTSSVTVVPRLKNKRFMV